MIKNSNIIITGTSSGIGRKLTIKFLKNGNKVWGCSRKGDSIKIKNYSHCKLDLSDSSKINAWIYKVSKDTGGKIDIFISNAAIFERKLNSLDTFQNITKTINVNLISSIWGAHVSATAVAFLNVFFWCGHVLVKTISRLVFSVHMATTGDFYPL